MTPFITPPPLTAGDQIAILSPATVIRKEYVEAGQQVMRANGYIPLCMPNLTYGADGTFAGNAHQRLDDLLAALTDPNIKAIWCARGGYGSVQLISRVPRSLIAMHPKWLIGFSDVCALHAMMLRGGVMSLHAPMMRRLHDHPDDDVTSSLFYILRGAESIEAEGAIHPLQKCGTAHGILLGGNLSVISDLADTAFDPFHIIGDRPYILMIEDVGESMSRLHRRLWRLRLAGIINKAAGIIVGQFSACLPGSNFTTAEDMIADLLDEWNVKCPVTYNFPVGHDDSNLPLAIGADTILEVTPFHSLVKQSLQMPETFSNKKIIISAP